MQYTLKYLDGNGDIINRDYFDDKDEAIKFANELANTYARENETFCQALCITDKNGENVYYINWWAD